MLSYYIKLYLATFIAFFVIDIIWLGLVARRFYEKHLGFLLTDKPLWPAASVFYLLFNIYPYGMVTRISIDIASSSAAQSTTGCFPFPPNHERVFLLIGILGGIRGQTDVRQSPPQQHIEGRGFFFAHPDTQRARKNVCWRGKCQVRIACGEIPAGRSAQCLHFIGPGGIHRLHRGVPRR